jgi:formate hydrogenlyase subunit 5
MTDRPGTAGVELDDLLATFGRPRAAPVAGEWRVGLAAADLAAASQRLARYGRFLSMTRAADPPELIVAFGVRGHIVELTARLDRSLAYPAVCERVEAAGWAEGELARLGGLQPSAVSDRRPLPADADAITPRLGGADAFVMPYGPVRSGVFEAIQFVIETGGEDIPLLDVRTGFKRRDLERRMSGMSVAQAAVVAERVAGISSVAHALAYAHAAERALAVEVPRRAQLWRVVHAELERIANHLHSAAQLAETTALHVGVARFAILKEDIMRLRAELTGSRFARGAIVPGGVAEPHPQGHRSLAPALDRFEADFRRDRRLLMGTTSFTDRLFGTGHLPRDLAERLAVVGPVARGSGVSTDVRFERPYGAYSRLGWEIVTRDSGDAMARLEVRLGEVAQSVHLIRQALEGLARTDREQYSVAVSGGEGVAWGWSEAAQGELLYRLAITDGRVREAHVASPSLRNWQAFARCFPKDVLTDFGFIEFSFQLTAAGADR